MIIKKLNFIFEKMLWDEERHNIGDDTLKKVCHYRFKL